MYIPINWLKPYLLPLVILSLAIGFLPYFSLITDSQKELLWILPFILGIVTVVLGQQFMQGRISLTAINMIIGFMVIHWFLQEPLVRNQSTSVFSFLSIFWVLNTFIIFWLPERKLLSSVSIGILALIAVEFVICMSILHWYPLHIETIQTYLPFYPVADIFGYSIQWVTSASISYLQLVLGVVMAGFAFYKKQRTSIAIFTCYALSCLVLGWFDQVNISLIFVTLAFVCLLYCLLMNSHDLAFIDELTELPGRRALTNALKHAGKNYTLVMADIDKFKNFNDTHGHEVGDDVLRLVAQELGKVTGGGKAFRYGGEEFTILFKNKTAEQAQPYVESIRAQIASYPMTLRDKSNRPEDKKIGKTLRDKKRKAKTVKVTMSFGIAQRKNTQEFEEVMKAADKKLYQAKENGRNRVEL